VRNSWRFILSNLVPDFLCELIARLLGYFARLVRPGAESTVEYKVRGILWALRFSKSRKLKIGRYVLLENNIRIWLGNNVAIMSGTQIVPGTLGRITIGDNSHISRNSTVAGGGDVSIGCDTKISSGVTIYSVTYERHQNQLLKDSKAIHQSVSIGDGVHIGANATILPGVIIEDNATIGAGAVVTKNVAENQIVVGSPARPIANKVNA